VTLWLVFSSANTRLPVWIGDLSPDRPQGGDNEDGAEPGRSGQSEKVGAPLVPLDPPVVVVTWM